MVPVTHASQFYDALPAEPKEAFAELSSLIDEESPEREAEWLDYKNGKDIPLDTTEGKDKVRALWGKALSGFANSGGGLVIWGIQTETVDNHDVPKNLALVPKPEQLEGLLKNYLGTEVEPPVLSVRLRSIANESGEGFVVADIPPSDLRPHEAKLQGKYYVRASHQHVKVGPSLLRILFYPSSHPVFLLQLIPFVRPGTPLDTFAIRIKNIGHSSADELFAIIQNKSNAVRISPLPGETFQAEGSLEDVWNFSRNKPLHPNLETELLSLHVSPVVDARLHVSIFARNFDAVGWILRLSPISQHCEVRGPISLDKLV